MKTITQLTNELRTAEPVQTGYRIITVKTQLRHDSHYIAECVIKIDLLNQKASSSYGRGVFSSYENYDDSLYVREILSDITKG